MLYRAGQLADRCDAWTVWLMRSVSLLGPQGWIKLRKRESNEENKDLVKMPHLLHATDTDWWWCNTGIVLSKMQIFLWLFISFKDKTSPWTQTQLIMTSQIQKWHFTFILHVLLLILQARWGHCHPQCLDYKPPFQPQQPLVFCKDYSKFGCCDLQKDEEIRTRFFTIMENFDHSGFVTCSKYIRSILCQVGKRVHFPYINWPSCAVFGTSSQ